MSFTEGWRKMHACERCRKQKVRCEYKDPASKRCIRCTKNNAECIVIDKTKKGNDKLEKNGKVSPPSHLNMDDTGSPLLRAVDNGTYTADEIASFYKMFVSVGSLIPVCEAPATLCELHKEYPWTALAIVTSVALSTSVSKSSERSQLVQKLLTTGTDELDRITYDTHSALLILLEYNVASVERASLWLGILHGSMGALQQRIKFGSRLHRAISAASISCDFQIVARLYEFTALTMMQWGFYPYLETVRTLANLYLPIHDMTVPEYSSYLVTVFGEYSNCQDLMYGATSLEDVWNTCVMTIDKINSAAQPNPRFLHYGSLAKIQIVASAMYNSVKHLNANSLTPYTHVVIEAVQNAVEFSQAFAAIKYECFPIPAVYAFVVQSLVSCMWSIRLHTFAVGMDLDVPVMDIYTTFNEKWKELLIGTFTGRRLFVTQIQLSDMVRLQVGFFNEYSGKVEGFGSMLSFFAYMMGPKGEIAFQTAMTAEDLRSIIRSDEHVAHMSAPLSMVPTSCEEFRTLFAAAVRHYI